MSTPSTHPDATIYQRPVELLQRLIRFNTTNPPGNEAECIHYIDTLLTEAGFQTTIIANDPARPNLIARLAGQGDARPLLLQGHIDVVTTEKQAWQQPPFEGKIVDNYLWGRGTLDMKGGVAMMLAALLRAKAEGTTLPGDVVLTLLSDEEAGGDNGAKFLIEHHAELFNDIRYALGEFGGFSITISGKKFYAIQVLEKQVCWMKVTLSGPGGHASLPMRNGATAKLGRLLQQLNQHRLPVHIIETTHQMLQTISATIGGPTGEQFGQLLDPTRTDATLDALSEQRQIIDPILHNTVNVTIIRGGNQINVIPSEIVLEMDGRLLPGYTPDDMLTELRAILTDEAEIEIVRHDQGRAQPDMGLFDTLATVLREADPGSVPIPFLTPVVTDGRFFSRLGIQTYG
ncbi:MAG TPA: M20/M25/M40 family metallo-hydrolase, partial [Ktedonobacteraceae bacterium]|nr:M20/M25/M40 family metallo-hydrolase [Ktedonobacteraceae bacterium]